MKVCSKCGKEKDLSAYPVDKRRVSMPSRGIIPMCKDCRRTILSEQYEANKEQRKERMRLWHAKNRKKASDSHKQWYLKNAEYEKARVKKWGEENWDKVLASARRTIARKRGTPKGKLSDSMSHGIWKTLSGSKAGRHWEELVGFTVNQLKRHIEKRFLPGMTWGNYGSYWHIDHKLPIAVFNYNHPRDIDFRLCWSLKNLQPLEAKKNIIKSAKIEEPFQPSLSFGGK